mmetsp:Transcript_36329/g.75589  ORF Transcript_36329/g.75589 Transcript_36329/m.75589 type:complete len:255 (+) Transcript_36329:689-1453(+)
MSRYLTTGMFGSILLVELSFLVLFFVRGLMFILTEPFLVLFIHFQFSFGVGRQGLYGAIHFVIGLHGFSGVVPTQGGKGHDFLLTTQIGLGDTIHFSHSHRHAFLFDFLGKFFPRWCKSLTPHTPRGKHINKGHFIFLQKSGKILLGQFHRMHTFIFVHFFQTQIVFFMTQFSLFPIASGKNPSRPRFIQLPLVDIFGHILSIGSQGIPHIDTDIIAMQIQQRNIEIESNLRFFIFIQGNGGGNFRGSKSGRFT